MPRVISWREGLNVLIVIAVASVVSVIVLMPFADCHIFNDDVDCLPSEQQMQFASIAWFTTAAYLYQYDYLVRDRRATKSKLKMAQPSQPSGTRKSKP